jgi:tetratricopeptide (TPR) repeat protein
MAGRCVVLVTCLVLYSDSTPRAQQAALGQISFPTSATGAAQAAFVRGVLFLHNFEYDDAIAAFREAQKLSPEFAMAYWGEALSYMQPIWYNENLPRARAVLSRLAPTAAARAAKAPTDREKGYLDAVEQLFGSGDRLTRLRACADRLARLSAQFPDDDEARLFQALMLLGTIPEGARNPDISLKAGAVAAAVLKKNPKHPGAAHYVLHAYDDGEHNAMALDAARIYATLAPASSHARHMPSHAYLPLGMWDEAAASDEAAFAASVAWAKRTGRPVSQQDFHSLGWLHYEYLQQGRFAKAREAVATVRRALEETSKAPGATPAGAAPGAPVSSRLAPSEIGRGYDFAALRNELASMRARAVIEGSDWEQMKGQPSFDNIDELFALGLSGVALQDHGRSEAAIAELRKASSALTDKDVAAVSSIMADELAGLLAVARGQREAGLKILDDAAAREAARPNPIARPYPVKPAGELYAEALFALGNPAASVAEYRRVLQRTPRRPLALLGLARAAQAANDPKQASRAASEFLRIWHAADADRPELVEARQLAGRR